MSPTTSPELPVAAVPETLENSLTKTRELLAKLRKELASASGEKDKSDYEAVAKKLEQYEAELNSGSAAAVEGAKHTLEDFRATLSPEHRVIYDKVEHGASDFADKSKKLMSEGASKAAEALRNSDIKAPAELHDIAKAASEGNLDAAQKAAKSLQEKGMKVIEENGQKLKQYTGLAALEKVFLEPFKEKGIFGGILQVLANLWKFVSSGFSWKETIPDVAKDVADAAAGKLGEAKDQLAKNLPKDKENIKQDAETRLAEIRQRFEKTISEEWGVDLSDKHKRAKLNEIWAKYHDRMLERAGRVGEGIVDNKTYNPLYEMLGSSSDVVDFGLDLVSEGIVPMGALKAKVAEGGKRAIQFGLSSVKAVATGGFDEIQMLIGEVSFDDLGKKLDSLNDTQRAMLTKIIVQKTALPFMLMGEIGAFAMNSMTLWATWNERVGWTALSAAYETSMNRFDKTANKIGELLALLGEKDSGQFSHVVENMRNVLIELQTKTTIAHLYMKSKTSEEFAERLDALKKTAAEPGARYSVESIDAVRSGVKTGVPLAENGGEIARILGNRVRGTKILQDGWDRMKSMFARETYRGPFANPELFADDLNLKADNALRDIAQAVRQKERWAVPRIWSRLKAAGVIHEVPGAASRGIVAVDQSNVEKFQQEIKMLVANEGPDMVRNFFSHFSLAVVAGLVATAPDGKRLETLGNSVSALIPFVGPIMLIGEGFTFEGMMPQHPVYLATGGALLAYDAYEFTKILASGASRGEKAIDTLKLVGRPITMAAGAVRDTVVLAGVMGQSSKLIFEAIRKGSAPEVGRLFAGLSLRSLPVAIAWVGAFAIGYKLMGSGATPESVEAGLKKEGIITANGTYDLEKLKQRLATLDPKTKQEVVSLMSASALFSQEKWTPLSHEVTPDGRGYNIRINDLATLSDQETLKNAFASLGIPLSMSYSADAQNEWMKRLKSLGFTDEQSRAAIWKELGLTKNPDKIA